jgi:hypothetical protein
VIVHRLNPKTSPARIKVANENKKQPLETIFSRFREPVRNGHFGIISLCSLIVFSINTIGDFIMHTLPCIFLLPLATKLLRFAWMQGTWMTSIQASSFVSLLLYSVVIFLETLSYIIASVAGVNIGLSVLVPKIHGVNSRLMAFKFSCVDMWRLYIVIMIILAIQAVWEMLYIRKILLMGGSAIPLMPY